MLNLAGFVLRTVLTYHPNAVFHHYRPTTGLDVSFINNCDTYIDCFKTCSPSLQYSRDFLLSRQHSGWCATESVVSDLLSCGVYTQRDKLDKSDFNTINNNVLSRRQRYRSAKRGKRGGSRKQRSIEVIQHNHTHKLAFDEKSDIQRPTGAQISNLTKVSTSSFYNKTSHLTFLYFNAQSCKNKCFQIQDLIEDSKADLVFITETWLKPAGDEPTIKEMLPQGFQILSFPRASRTGGGVAILCKSCLDVSVFDLETFSSFEHCAIKVKSPQGNLFCSCIYRPPPNRKNPHTSSKFLDEFSDFLDALTEEKNVFILGDFNFHYESSSDPSVKRLKTLISEHGIDQLVQQSTHRKGHTLDLVLCRSDFHVVSSVKVTDFCLSDHFPISFEISFEKPLCRTERKLCRNLKAITIDTFKETLNASLSTSCPKTIDELNSHLRSALDVHAPLRAKVVRSRPAAPWLNQRVQEAKKERRRAERRWRKTGLTIHKDIYLEKQKLTSRIVKEEKYKYYNDQIVGSGSSKDLFNICNDLLGKGKDQVIPTTIPIAQLPETFNTFFMEKIRKIREELDVHDLEPHFEEYTQNSFSCFEPVTDQFVKSIIVKSPKNFCQLDPLPASLFLECLDVIIPFITVIINDSLQKGLVPSSFKEAIVKPLIKKSTLNPNELKNYRPVSNLPFLSKVLEKVVLYQMNTYLDENCLKQKLQSAYKQKHSTETALLKVQSDLLLAADEGMVTLLAFLDLSSAFDTIDHAILLKRLNISFGFRGTALKWFESYISDRQQSVSIGQHLSRSSLLHFGVPQGSVLGPTLFSLYSQSLCNILSQHDFRFHQYADDTQLYKSIPVHDIPQAVHSLSECVKDISVWMSSNKLKLNESKTEVLVMGTKSKVHAANLTTVTLCDKQINVSSSVRNLGVIFDSNLNMDCHIAQVRKTCYLELRKIAQIRTYLTVEATNKLVCSFVLSRLDYCNSLLAGLPDTHIHKLQQIQNNAARLVMQTRRREHITPTLKYLHWLPITSRIHYKIASLTYKCQQDPDFPAYLKDLIIPYKPSRPLRSSNQNLLQNPKTKLKTFGQRALPSQAAEVWNKVPQHTQQAQSIISFQTSLKTHYFKNHFGS